MKDWYIHQFFIVSFDVRRSLSIADLTYIDLMLGIAISLFRRATESDVLGKAPAQIAADFWEDLSSFINAEEMFRIATSLYEDIGDRYSIARGLYYLGRYLRDHNQPDKARAVLRQSLKIFEALDLPSAAATIRQILDSTA